MSPTGTDRATMIWLMPCRLLVCAALVAWGTRLEAHAVLRMSSPTNGASVTGPNVPVKLVFNVRVEAARSKLELLRPDASTVELPAQPQPSPDTLVSKIAGLEAGRYALRWQVLAADGHISRGEIRFTVINPSS